MKAFTAVSLIIGAVGAFASNLRSGVPQVAASPKRDVIAVLSMPYASDLRVVDAFSQIATMDVSAIAVGMYDMSGAGTSSNFWNPLAVWNMLEYMDRVNVVALFKHYQKSVYMAAKLTLDNQAIVNGLKGADVAATYCNQVPQGLFDGLMLQLDTSDVGYRMAVDDFVTDFVASCKQILGDKPLMLAMSVDDITDNNIPVLSDIGKMSASIASIDILQFGDVQKDPMTTYNSMFVSSASSADWSDVAKNSRSAIRVAKTADKTAAGYVDAATLSAALGQAEQSLSYKMGVTVYDHQWASSVADLTAYYSTIAN